MKTSENVGLRQERGLTERAAFGSLVRLGRGRGFAKGRPTEWGRTGAGRRAVVWLGALVLVWIPLGLTLWAQGVVDFQNRNLSFGIDAPVYLPDCVTRVEGVAFRAQLYAGVAGASESSLRPVSVVVSFRTGDRAGYIAITGGDRVVAIPGVPPGEWATVQMRAWAAPAETFEAARESGLLYGVSNLVVVLTVDPYLPGPPTPLIGLESFCLVPEAGSVGLLAWGGLLLVFANGRRRRGSRRPGSFGAMSGALKTSPAVNAEFRPS